LTIAAQGEGIQDLVTALDRHFEHLTGSGELERRRRKRLADRTREVVDRATRKWVWDETRAEQMINERLDQVVGGQLSPYELAAEVLDGLKQGTRL
jgi:LAO/AO transport system kinase